MSLSGTIDLGVHLDGDLSFLDGRIDLPIQVSGALSFLEGQIDLGIGISGSLYTTALVSWFADDSKKLNLSIDMSGSLGVGATVVPPPAIFGS